MKAVGTAPVLRDQADVVAIKSKACHLIVKIKLRIFDINCKWRWYVIKSGSFGDFLESVSKIKVLIVRLSKEVL